MIVAGFGFRAEATRESFVDALSCATSAIPAGRPADMIACIASKSDHAAFAAFARDSGLKLVSVSPEEIVAQETATQSEQSFAAHRTGSVAEATALAAAGEGATLLAARAISKDRKATCACAQGFDAGGVDT